MLYSLTDFFIVFFSWLSPPVGSPGHPPAQPHPALCLFVSSLFGPGSDIGDWDGDWAVPSSRAMNNMDFLGQHIPYMVATVGGGGRLEEADRTRLSKIPIGHPHCTVTSLSLSGHPIPVPTLNFFLALAFSKWYFNSVFTRCAPLYRW